MTDKLELTDAGRTATTCAEAAMGRRLAPLLDEEMIRIGIIAEPTGLADEELALALWQACDGIIGQLMSVVRQALRISIHDDRDFISVDDLVIAVDDWSISLGLCDTNPLERLLLEAA